MWDYPRPPALVASDRLVVVRRDGEPVAETRRAVRVLETSHPPTWYVPPEDVARRCADAIDARTTLCEWKGAATYWDVLDLEAAAWSFEQPDARLHRPA